MCSCSRQTTITVWTTTMTTVSRRFYEMLIFEIELLNTVPMRKVTVEKLTTGYSCAVSQRLKSDGMRNVSMQLFNFSNFPKPVSVPLEARFFILKIVTPSLLDVATPLSSWKNVFAASFSLRQSYMSTRIRQIHIRGVQEFCKS